MNAPKETLRVRLASALDAGIDGITLSAGLHLGSFALIADHPRFRDAKLGIIVSSLRALQLFLRKNARLGRAARLHRRRGAAGRRAPRFRHRRLGAIRSAHHRHRDPAVSESRTTRHPGDSGRRHFHRQRRGFLSRNRRRRGAGGDAFHGDARMRPAGQGQAGILQGERRGHRGQHDLADRLPDAHAQKQPGDRRRHPAQLRGLRLPARRHRQLRLHHGLQPRSRRASGARRRCR